MLTSTRQLLTLCAATACAGALLPSGGALAADEIGSVSKDSSGNCSDQARFVIGVSDEARVPHDGVVTRLRSENAGQPGVTFAYRFARTDGPGKFVGVATVPATVGDAGKVDVATRVAVRAGDHMGISKGAGSGLDCIHAGTASIGSGFGNYADGEAFGVYVGEVKGALNMIATIEPDVDRDGFGDETQDACAGSAGGEGGCAPKALPPEPPKVEQQQTPLAAVCTVPKLKGLKLKTAKRKLRTAGCAVGKVKRPKSARKAKQRRLRIKRQSVRPGTQVAAGTKVALRVKVKAAKKGGR